MARKRADGEGSLRKRKDGRWEARYTDPRETDPKKRSKSISNKSQKVVIARLKAALAEIDCGVPLLANDNPTVAEWLSIWMKEYAVNYLRDSTYESYEMNIKDHISPLTGQINLKDLTGTHIQAMYNILQKPKKDNGHELSPSTIAKIKNILSGALKQAITNHIIRSNPLLEAKAPKVNDPEIRTLTKAEQQQFIAALPFFNTGNLFAIALATGMRIGELCALDVNDIDRERKLINITKTAGRRKDKHTGEVSIKVGPPKTKHSIRKIPLLPSVEVILERQAQLVAELRSKAGNAWNDNTLVFPTDEGNIHHLSGLRSSMARVLKRAGLPHIAIHALRHTYATTVLNTGVAAQNVARLLGHKDGATTLKFYAHYINTEAITQLEKLEQQNVCHLGITAAELERITMDAKEAISKCSVAEQVDETILKSKNLPPKKAVLQVLSVCEDILCQPLENFTAQDREVLLGVLAQYTVMKRRHAEQERMAKPKKKDKER
jgi:integrase